MSSKARFHDYRRQGWGHTFEPGGSKNGGREISGNGYGSGIRVGDVIGVYLLNVNQWLETRKCEDLVEGADDLVLMYRITKVWPGRPRDWFNFEAVRDDTVFSISEDGNVKRVEGDDNELDEGEEIALNLVNASGGVEAQPGNRIYDSLRRLHERGLVKLEGRRYVSAS